MHAKLYSAVAANHQRGFAVLQGGLDQVGRAAGDLHHRREVVRTPVLPIRVPARAGHVAVVDHGHARRPEPLHQTGYHPRSLLLARPVGARDGRDADETDPP